MRTTAEDRERFAISTVIAVGIHLVFFLFLLGLHWPPSSELRSISPPVTLSVQLVGDITAPPPLPAQPTAPVGQAPSAGGPAAQTASGASALPPLAAGTGEAAGSATTSVSAAPQHADAAPSQGEAAPSSSAGSAGGSLPAEGSSAGRAGSTAGSSAASIQPYYSTGTTLPSGPQGGGASAPSAGRGGGAAQPGINYEAQSNGTPYPAQGGANPGSTGGPVTAQVLQGSAASGEGNSINQQLLEQAGSGVSASGAGAAGGGSASAGGATSGLGAGGTGQGGASDSSQSGMAGAASTGSGGGGAGPSIQWENQAARRSVVFRPPDPVIPQDELAQLPPKTAMIITFAVSPSGTVRVLNISPPPAYPWLESLLSDWMGRWLFNSIKGTQVAQGKLQYVIQANTAE